MNNIRLYIGMVVERIILLVILQVLVNDSVLAIQYGSQNSLVLPGIVINQFLKMKLINFLIKV